MWAKFHFPATQIWKTKFSLNSYDWFSITHNVAIWFQSRQFSFRISKLEWLSKYCNSVRGFVQLMCLKQSVTTYQVHSHNSLTPFQLNLSSRCNGYELFIKCKCLRQEIPTPVSVCGIYDRHHIQNSPEYNCFRMEIKPFAKKKP